MEIKRMGKILIFVGLILIIVGVVFTFFGKLPFGKLPGDIYIQRKNFSFYFPVTTAILISLIISLILYLVNRFRF